MTSVADIATSANLGALAIGLIASVAVLLWILEVTR